MYDLGVVIFFFFGGRGERQTGSSLMKKKCGVFGLRTPGVIREFVDFSLLTFDKFRILFLLRKF